MIPLAWCLVGLMALVGGAEVLTRAGTRLAALVGIPPILIGLTVVAIGTSTPELAVGIQATLEGSGSLSIGNIAGANTFNILFILGLSALLMPLTLELRAVRFDLPVMIAAAAALLVMAWDGVLTRVDGAILVGSAIVYTGAIIRTARRESRAVKAEYAAEYRAPRRRAVRDVLSSAGALCFGIATIVVGADWLVDGAIELARMLDVSDAFVGATIVTVGTSSPELVTTVVSTLRQQRDIAVGNLIGSSVYNILFILGTIMLVPAAIEVEPVLIQVNLPVMCLAAVACIPTFVSGHRLTRLEGGLFVAAYLAYLSYLIAAQT